MCGLVLASTLELAEQYVDCILKATGTKLSIEDIGTILSLKMFELLCGAVESDAKFALVLQSIDDNGCHAKFVPKLPAFPQEVYTLDVRRV